MVLSLNRFGACPREGHLDLAVRCFRYVKAINKKIDIDSRPIKFIRTTPKFVKLIPDLLKDYSDVTEDMDPSFPFVFGTLL